MRFFGTNTPFSGERIYLVQPMGYLNATENADRVIQRVLQPVITEGRAARITDNMFTGADTPEEAITNLGTILALCANVGINLKAPKTIICPSRITIQGRVWHNGTMAPSAHIMSMICKALLPTTVKQLRGFNGEVKQMKDNLPTTISCFSCWKQPQQGKNQRRESPDRMILGIISDKFKKQSPNLTFWQ